MAQEIGFVNADILEGNCLLSLFDVENPIDHSKGKKMRKSLQDFIEVNHFRFNP
jgi:hypothetical protein